MIQSLDFTEAEVVANQREDLFEGPLGCCDGNVTHEMISPS